LNCLHFMLKHTDEALMIYDLQSPVKSQYAYQAIKRYQDSNDYNLDLLDMDWLEVSSQDYLTENAEKDLQ
ncbi:MAG: SLOG family protein, partial [Liquorilactobacillus ghanensis]|uniref:SLOG family protein n=1 Tax=Liquorilactobacillus ghanensis TaxID=399370 RepID=UPI0039E992D3